MRIKFPVTVLALFSIWISIFTPFISAQNSVKPLPIDKIGLEFRLSEAPKVAVKTTPTPTTPNIENLTQTEADQILQRLPKMPENAETADFKMRSDSLKPPRTGEIIPQTFPADEKRDAPKLPTQTDKPLQIARFSPEGNTSFVSDLSITFSQPMITVSSQTEVSETVPVKLTPEVKGKWRWLGTDTLIFDADTRFPMATKFTATIPKGTKSAIGGILTNDFTWTFTTPPPNIEAFAPKTPYEGVFPSNAIMTTKFNQEIDVNAVLPKIRVLVNGKKFAVKSVAENNSTRWVEGIGEIRAKYWIAFQTIETLPLNSEVQILFEKDLPSAEGLAMSKNEQSFSFKTMGEFRVAQAFCGYNPDTKNCQPSDDLRIRYSRSFNPVPFDKSLIKIEPPIEDAEIVANNGEVLIKGKKKPNTDYKITLSGEAIDYYKQKIGKDISTIFNVTIERPQFFAQGGDFVTLDPSAKPVFSVYTKNHPNFKVRLYSVMPEEYSAYQRLLYVYRDSNRVDVAPFFGKLIFEKTVETKSETDVLTETRIDLSEALLNKFGHAVLIAEPLLQGDSNYRYYNRAVITWIQSTNIGVDLLVDYEKIFALATDLKSGMPLSQTEFSFPDHPLNLPNTVVPSDGFARLNNMKFGDEEIYLASYLIAKNKADSAILDNISIDWRSYRQADSKRWFIFDDRKMYRPNEEISIKGYIRKVTGGKFTDLAEPGEMAKKIYYSWRDPQNNEITKGVLEPNIFGGFDLKLKLPENINLGYQRINFWARGDKPEDFWTNDQDRNNPEFVHTFQVQEFRRPEFEVNIAAETPAPYLVGNSATISAEAKYFTGGALAGSVITWRTNVYQTTYSPPNHEDFTFGTFVPWWRNYSEYLPNNNGAFPAQNLNGTTDENGKHRVNLDFISAKPARPYTLRATATTFDVNRQAIADTKTFLVHPSNVYVGLRTAKTFLRQNEPLKVEAIAADIDGKIVRDAPITIKAELKVWQSVGGSSQQKTIDTQTCQIKSGADTVLCNFTAKEGGTFVISATVLDEKERPNTSEITVWVAGGTTAPKRGVEQETAEMIPDKKEYSPNETAEILVNAPFSPAEGVMTLERNGILKTERFSMNEPTKVLQIPIQESYLPNVHVKVDLVGVANRTNDKGEIDFSLPKRPAFAGGELNLSVSKASRKLQVAVEPLVKTLEPSQKTDINIEVKDNNGKAVANSEVALVAVDESVLSLTDYKIQNPLDAFYQQIQPNVAHYHSRARVVLGNVGDITLEEQLGLSSKQRVVSKSMVSLDGVGIQGNTGGYNAQIFMGRRNNQQQDTPFRRMEILTSLQRPPVAASAPINLRQNFDALAIFSPSVKTDANGKATVNLTLPDNLTRYRITAVAVTKSKQFGLGESNITAKQSLQVRPSAPRFLNFGDQAELPVVLQNQTNSPMTISVAIRSKNAALTNGNGRKVTVPANDRAEIRFPVATEKSGLALFQIGAVGGNFTDATQIAFPVYTPATSEAFTTYGTTDQNGAIVQKIAAPKDVYSDFGGLEVTTSSTQLQELTDAFIYLQNYPFECSEQISSRMLSVAALR
ncbi:MAG TPA: alpha-2-macroglobulin family protein, partial [Pyrinomonadaceae bacterium]|nr:alpha-2-macroglobulin family protein [Pyrinomonadaceae bacterium]